MSNKILRLPIVLDAPTYQAAPYISSSPKESSQGQFRLGPGLSVGSKQRYRSGLPGG